MASFRFPVRQLHPALQGFANEMESFVDHVLNSSDCANGSECSSNGAGREEAKKCYVPLMDIYESESAYDLYLDLPGVKTEQVKLEMHEDRLLVSGTRVNSHTASDATSHRVERSTGDFSRSIRLPKQVDSDKITASIESGVLHIVVPKQVKPSPRTIEIRTGS